MHIEFYLPFPPSVNNYYVKTARGVYISNKGRKFRDQAAESVIEQLPGLVIPDRLLFQAVLFPPDNRRRDMDNYNKPLMDALTHIGLWGDDVQVDQLMIYRGETLKPKGMTFVRISLAGPVLPLKAIQSGILDSM